MASGGLDRNGGTADGNASGLNLRRLTILLGLLSAFGPLSTDMYMPGLPALARTFGTSAGAQLTLSVCVLGMGIGQLVAGPLSDAHGRRRPLLIGLTAYTVTSALCAVAPELWMLLVLRLIQGVTGGSSIVIARAVAADVSAGAARVRLYARLMLVYGVAPILAPIIGGEIVSVSSWRTVFAVLTGVGAMLLFIVWRSLRETFLPPRRGRDGNVNAVSAVRSLLGNRQFNRAAAASTLGTAGLLAYIASMSFAFKSAYGLSAQGISLAFALSACGMILGSALSSSLIHRADPLTLLRAGQWLGSAAAAALLIAALIHQSLAVVLILVFCGVAAIGFCAPISLALAVGADAQNAGSAAGLVGVAGSVLGALSAPAAGLLGTGITLVSMTGLMAAYAFLAAVVTLMRAPERMRHGATPPPADSR